MCATATQTAAPVTRTLKVIEPLADVTYAVVTEGRRTDAYRLQAGHVTVRWVHAGDEARGGIVTVNGAGRATGCDCRGWRHSGKCRHAAGTEAVIARGLVTPGVVAEANQAMADQPDGWLTAVE